MAWGWGFQWRPYVPVAQRRARAAREMAKLAKKGAAIQPVHIEGRQIARTFWGQAWCAHLEKFSDFANRLPRGRTYVRNGSVCHLGIKAGVVEAKVSGSEIYDVRVKISALPGPKWAGLKRRCAGQVGSLLELLQGRLSDHVMAAVTDTKTGLFPGPREMTFKCSCPDWADMCKHVAAVLYGVGARLDEKPELLFLLRGVDHAELVSEEAARKIAARKPKAGRRTLEEGRLGEVFGIDVAPAAARRPAGAGAAEAEPAGRGAVAGGGIPSDAAAIEEEPGDAAGRDVPKRRVRRPRRRLSAKARVAIAKAQQRRWAKYRREWEKKGRGG
jgi:uncharacterized Zn finger protein